MNETTLIDFYNNCAPEAQNFLDTVYPVIYQDDNFTVLFLQTPHALIAGVMRYLQHDLAIAFSRALGENFGVCTVEVVLTSEPISQTEFGENPFRKAGDVLVYWAPEPLPDLRTLEVPDFAQKPNWPIGYLVELDGVVLGQVIKGLGEKYVLFQALEIRTTNGDVFSIPYDHRMKFREP